MDSANNIYDFNIQLMLRKGKQLARMGRWSDARDVYHEVLRLSPGNRVAHTNLAFVYYEMGMDDEARAEFERANL